MKPTQQLVRVLIVSAATLAAATTSVQAKKISVNDLSHSQQQTLARVTVAFAKYPDLIPVAYCESSLEHFNPDGSVKQGEVDPRDTGLMQINTKYHLEDSRRLGFDIFTEQGNKAYALYLRKHQGLQPWNSSRDCWEDLILPDVRMLALS